MPELAHGEAGVGQILAAAVAEVLETMFFTGLLGPAAPPEGEGTAAVVRFRGAPSGACGVWLPEAAAQELAASFLGLETAELVPAQIEQVVCEFANMICGSVVSRLERGAQIHLDSPRLAAGEEFRAVDGSGPCWFEMETGTLGLALRLEETQ